MSTIHHSSDSETKDRERLLRLLAVSTFLIFFQGYMVAPMIPRLSTAFRVPEQQMGLLVPAYLIPYGISTLLFGLLSDRIGRKRIMLCSLLAFVALTALTAASTSATQMILCRLLTGLGASGIVPLGLALVGIQFPLKERGRPLGWLFGAMAGGMAFGSTLGIIVEPAIGWRGLFVGVSVCGFLLLLLLRPYFGLLGERPPARTLSPKIAIAGYTHLLSDRRAQRTYVFVFLNAVFHSGVFTWLGLYFSRRFGLGEIGIGLALLGYGVPGFLLGPLIGRAADRWGRRRLIPVGIVLAALSAFVLVPAWPLAFAAGAVTTLSLGYDMTQPALAGIVTTFDPTRAGQAMGLNVFALFTGFGVGSLIFSSALRLGFAEALMIFAAVQTLTGIAGIAVFRSE